MEDNTNIDVSSCHLILTTPQDVARSLAISASILVSRQLYALTSLVQRLADMVQYNPQYDAVQDLFRVQAPTLHSQVLHPIVVNHS